ncbi:DUF711 family protein [Shewanella sp. YIC-542]|uniref:DUF711 family protein n=1 Tax=Shewanella mytili TaxID=3377111 RepID=UPI00398E5906
MVNYKNKELCKIRTITTFISLGKDRSTWEKEIEKASSFCTKLSEEFIDNGYIVQSVRIVTNSFGDYLNVESYETAKADLQYISQLLEDANKSGLRVRFAIGEAKTKHEIKLVPELIRDFGDLCNVCVNVSLDEFGILNNDLIDESAKTVLKISQITERGEGNFNFTVNFNCKPLIPYFPAGYHDKKLGDCFVIGLETPDLLVSVLKEYNQSTTSTSHNERQKNYYQVMSNALQHHISSINKIILDLEYKHNFKFSGFDSSAAPSKNCSSMAEVYEEMGVEYFGSSGTVEASSLLTRVFKSLKGVNLVGFSGLMLALTEDTGLAEGTKLKNFDIRSLLTFSSVCGIGLDTVPIPGDTTVNKISALMRDTGTMAYRLNKPLTVRLFPVPGLAAGEYTAFESDDLCNCAVLPVP